MAYWKLYLLGEESINANNGEAFALPDASWSLIGAVLAAPRRRIDRAQLAGILWPDNDEESARHCLASTLWRLKRRLGCDQPLLTVSDDTISFANMHTLWVDSIAFERRTQAALNNPDSLRDASVRMKLRRALESYRGDFLPRRSGEAVEIERERLRALFLDAGLELALACARHDEWRTTLELAKTLCNVEPLREDAQRLLIEAMVACGNRPQAIQHYKEFERLLEAELGVRPMCQTRTLVENIADGPKFQPPPPLFVDQLAQRDMLIEARQQTLAILSMLDRVLTQY